jgi:hypothetical protein
MEFLIAVNYYKRHPNYGNIRYDSEDKFTQILELAV